MFGFILISRRAFFLMTLIVVLSVFGCASTPPIPDADTDKWIGTVSGMLQGDLEFFTEQIPDQEDEYSVTGPFTMTLKATAGGYGSGTITGQMEGKVKNGTMKANIRGDVQVEDGSSKISGKMIGTISKKQAFGTWKIEHSEGSHSGEWVAEKTAE